MNVRRLVHDPAHIEDITGRHVYTGVREVGVTMSDIKSFQRTMPGHYSLEVKILFMGWWLSAIDTLVMRWSWEPVLQRYHDSGGKAEAQTANMGSVKGRFVNLIQDLLEGNPNETVKLDDTARADLRAVLIRARGMNQCHATAGIRSMDDVSKEIGHVVGDVFDATRELIKYVAMLEAYKDEA